MSRRSFALLAVLLTVVSVPLVAQSTAAGKWTAEVPEAVKNEDGVQTVISTTTITFQLEIRGDSVVGTVARGRTPVARPVRGTIEGAKVMFMADGRARVNLNGEETVVALITTYRFTLDGDTMRGTSETTLDPATKSPSMLLTMGIERKATPVTATRVKA